MKSAPKKPNGLPPVKASFEIDFAVEAVKDLADGAPRIVIDLPINNLYEAMMLWNSKVEHIYLHAVISISELENLTKFDEKPNEAKQKTKIEIKRVGRNGLTSE